MIKLLFTKNLGSIVGNVVDSLDNDYISIENPLTVECTVEGVRQTPTLMLSSESVLKLPKSELCTEPHDVYDGMLNSYLLQYPQYDDIEKSNTDKKLTLL